MRKKILCQEIHTNKTISKITSKTISNKTVSNKINNIINKDSKIKIDKTIFKNKNMRRRNIHLAKLNRKVLLNSKINLKQFSVLNVKHMAIMLIIVITLIKKTINNRIKLQYNNNNNKRKI